MSKFDVHLTRRLLIEARGPILRDDPVGTSPVLCALNMAIDHIDALEARMAKLERVREAAEKTKCVTPEVGPRGNFPWPRGNFPCFVCPVCELHRALAACDDGEGATCKHPKIAADHCVKCGEYVVPQP